MSKQKNAQRRLLSRGANVDSWESLLTWARDFVDDDLHAAIPIFLEIMHRKLVDKLVEQRRFSEIKLLFRDRSGLEECMFALRQSMLVVMCNDICDTLSQNGDVDG